MTDDSLQAALERVPNASEIIVRELRMMAAGEAQYDIPAFVSPWVKNVWQAAADIIEHSEHQKLS
jgi:hypothetical protein